MSLLDSLKLEDDETERNLWSITECFVYRVPARKSASERFRADQWGLDKPMITARLAVVEKENLCTVKLWDDTDSSSPKLVCAAPIDIENSGPKSKIEFFVEAVVDSSRYFVLRIVDKKTNRSALIGIGFRVRDSAFSFQQAIQEHIRFVRRQASAEKLQVKYDMDSTSDKRKDTFVPSEKFALKEGQSVTISLGSGAKKKKKKKKKVQSIKADSKSNKSDVLLLPPPSTTTTSTANEDDEWGDFQ